MNDTVTGPPRRRFELTLTVSADSWLDALIGVNRIAEHVQEHGTACSLISAGYNHSVTIRIEERPEVTHDVYFEQLEVFLGRKPQLGEFASHADVEVPEER